MPPLSDSDHSRLFARICGRKPDYASKRRAISPLAEAARAVLERLGGAEQGRLVQLWRNWTMVMGPDLAGLAIPLGTRKQVLLIGGEDTMAMQELSYQIPEILERVNAFMDTEYFNKVELRLLLGREALDVRIAGAAVPSGLRPRQLPPRPADLESAAGRIDPDSPVGRCYAAYVRMFMEQ